MISFRKKTFYLIMYMFDIFDSLFLKMLLYAIKYKLELFSFFRVGVCMHYSIEQSNNKRLYEKLNKYNIHSNIPI